MTSSPRDAVVTTELELKYAGYFERERAQADKLRRMGAFALDEALPYDEMRSLSFEARQKLAALRPRTLAQAASDSRREPDRPAESRDRDREAAPP